MFSLLLALNCGRPDRLHSPARPPCSRPRLSRRHRRGAAVQQRVGLRARDGDEGGQAGRRRDVDQGGPGQGQHGPEQRHRQAAGAYAHARPLAAGPDRSGRPARGLRRRCRAWAFAVPALSSGPAVGPALGRVAPLDRIFNVGPFPAPGGRELPNNLAQLAGPSPWAVISGPSTRRVIDFASPDQAVGINPVGQSGVLLDEHYADQAADYIAGRYQRMHLEPGDVQRNTRSTLTLEPDS